MNCSIPVVLMPSLAIKSSANALSAARLEQFGCRNGVFETEEVAVLSDGAPWIRSACEGILSVRNTTFVLDLYRALEYASATALRPSRSGLHPLLRGQHGADALRPLRKARTPGRS